MSRTDVHRPYRVQVTDPYERHRFYRFSIWPDRTEPVPISGFTCGCRMCTGQLFRKQARRRERTALRAQLRQALKTPAEQRDTIDVPAPRNTAGW
jgi:hypothetical protein